MELILLFTTLFYPFTDPMFCLRSGWDSASLVFSEGLSSLLNLP